MSRKFFLFSIMVTLILAGINTCAIWIDHHRTTAEPKLLWHEDFEDADFSDWVIHDDVEDEISNWFVDQGYLIQTSNIGKGKLGTHAVAGETEWTDYTLSANVVSTDDDYIGVLFRYQDPQNYYRFSLSSQVSKIRLEKRINGEFHTLGHIEEMWPECRFNISIDVRGDSIKVYLDGQIYFAIADTSFDHGNVGFSSYHNDASFLDDISVYDKFEIKHDEQALQFDRKPYLQNVLGDSAVVMWRTNLVQNSQVEFGLSVTETQVVSSQNLAFNHELTLTGLQAGAQYFYRVTSGTLMSDWVQFQAAKSASEPFRFALYGDNRTNFLRHQEIVASITEEAPDFVINSGDVVNSGLRPDWDTEYFNPLQDLISSTPVYVALGNHENNTLYGQKYADSPEQNPAYSRYFKEYFSFPENEHEVYYSFTYGNTFFIFIDNNLAAYSERDFPDITPGSAQFRWLEEQLKSPEAQAAEWLLVAGHIPIFSAVYPVDYILNREYLWPLFKKYDVDMYFSGHIHDYERAYVDGITHIVSGGGGGPQNTNVRNIVDIRKRKNNYHYCIIDVDSSELSFTVRDKDQNIMDEFVINKHPRKLSNVDMTPPEVLMLTVNPARSQKVPLMIRLDLPSESDYDISIHNSQGKLIKSLIDGHAQQGRYWLHWKKDDLDGILVPAGTYTCQVKTTSATAQIDIEVQN
ncbi:MAG: hypothetical protein HON27_16615 [Candidatus Marinimicrobia bacterium]|jgi:acid phosphatase type 7|nr:hypothetical protein [Candidatus Neomarinimicrobiota bacterium]MBT4361717.1 hypothetical protein [Candidatus Neomarinimicrobiota bacterium]MBT4947768.1 hypothetical protein [Candidatus Neomarinimicrobiota bacterium]MBT5271255.1 hypothetical protein [Candidatus Neomarinimicrobiota bacterium]MBT6009954.1 hypothetical protein [Candidatus Neomarinimicrobiota bacterium]